MSEPQFKSSRQVAAILGLPHTWIRSEAIAGRLPHIRAGRRLLFNIEAVEAALLDRARASGKAVRDAR